MKACLAFPGAGLSDRRASPRERQGGVRRVLRAPRPNLPAPQTQVVSGGACSPRRRSHGRSRSRPSGSRALTAVPGGTRPSTAAAPPYPPPWNPGPRPAHLGSSRTAAWDSDCHSPSRRTRGFSVFGVTIIRKFPRKPAGGGMRWVNGFAPGQWAPFWGGARANGGRRGTGWRRGGKVRGREEGRGPGPRARRRRPEVTGLEGPARGQRHGCVSRDRTGRHRALTLK